MTREEIIKYLNILKAFFLGSEHQPISDAYFALDEAIKELEQEPCEDCISRQAVLDATVKRNSIWNAITNSKGENLEEIISQLPPVTPKGVTVTDFADRCRECGKMRKGHWIYDETIENWRCSKCNETPKTMGYVGTADFMAEHFKFCNHCGADMRGVKKARDKE